MNNVNKILPYSPVPDSRSKVQRNPDETRPKLDSTAANRTDYTDLSSEWATKDSAGNLVDELLSAFRKNYPELDIYIADKLDKNSLPDAAAALGDGTHLLISREFLDEMKSSQESYQKGKSILIKLLGQLSANGSTNRAQGVYVDKNEALFWSAQKQKPEVTTPAGTPDKGPHADADSPPSLIEQLWKTQESAQKTYSEMYKNKTKVSLRSISSSFANLSAARTKGQVQSVIAKTQQNISTLRLASALGDNEERMKARAAIASMQKLLQRGGRKIRRLNEEELVRLRQKRAQRQQEQQRELQLRIEREKMRARRQSADGAIKKEGELEELNQAMRFSRYNKQHSYETLSPVPSIPAIPDAPVSAPGDGATAQAPLAAADISISSVSIEF